MRYDPSLLMWVRFTLWHVLKGVAFSWWQYTCAQYAICSLPLLTNDYHYLNESFSSVFPFYRVLGQLWFLVLGRDLVKKVLKHDYNASSPSLKSWQAKVTSDWGTYEAPDEQARDWRLRLEWTTSNYLGLSISDEYDVNSLKLNSTSAYFCFPNILLTLTLLFYIYVGV